MMIESDGAEEVGKWLSQSPGNRAHRGLRNVTISVMKGMQQAKQRRGMTSPLIHELLINQFLIHGLGHEGILQ